MRIEFTVPGNPVAQPRQRHRIVKPKGRAPYVHNYTPDKHPVQDYKAAIRLAVRQVYQGPALTCPVSMTIVFVMPRPSTMRWKRKAMPRVPHSGHRNDWDNLGKSVSDALTGRVYTDDGLIWDVRVRKYIAAGGEKPHTRITIVS